MAREGLNQAAAAEISPVPVGRRHLCQRFFVKPGPDAKGIMTADNILKRHHLGDNIKSPLLMLCKLRIQQAQRIRQGIPGGMNEFGIPQRGMVARAAERRPKQMELRIIPGLKCLHFADQHLLLIYGFKLLRVFCCFFHVLPPFLWGQSSVPVSS
ncbi:hypothetical protein D3C81_1532330 [compost metagenome]